LKKRRNGGKKGGVGSLKKTDRRGHQGKNARGRIWGGWNIDGARIRCRSLVNAALSTGGESTVDRDIQPLKEGIDLSID